MLQLKKWLYVIFSFLTLSPIAFAAVNPEDLLPAEQAFVPTLTVSDQNISVQFKIADGYYLYQSKITADTEPNISLSQPQFSPGEEKEDEFFGKQTVYHQHPIASKFTIKVAPK